MTSPHSTGSTASTPRRQPEHEDLSSTRYFGGHELEHTADSASLYAIQQQPVVSHPYASCGIKLQPQNTFQLKDSSTPAYSVVTESQFQSEVNRDARELHSAAGRREDILAYSVGHDDSSFSEYQLNPDLEVCQLRVQGPPPPPVKVGAPPDLSEVPAPRVEQSDLFTGTSQAYGGEPTNQGGGYFTRRQDLASHRQPVESDQEVDEHQFGDYRVDVLSPSLQQMGLRQLGVLFKARGRHIAELTQQISAQAEDNERHVGILRHEKVHVHAYTVHCNLS